MPLTSLLADVRARVLHVRHADAALRAAAAQLARRDCGASPLLAALRQREAESSTAIGHGVAIPHARLAGVAHPRATLMRLRTPVPFAAPDRLPVDLVFAMAIPADYTEQYLALLSSLAARFSDAGFRETLRQAPDAGALRARLLGTSRQPRTAAA